MNRRTLFCILLTIMVLTAGCAVQTEETSGGGEEIHMTEDGEYYTFQDVEGNSYEAPLLSDVPQCTYDFDHLKTDETTGHKSFKDEKNGVTARFGIDVSEFKAEVTRLCCWRMSRNAVMIFPV